MNKEKILLGLMARKNKIQEDYDFVLKSNLSDLRHSNAMSVIDGRKKELNEIILFIEDL